MIKQYRIKIVCIEGEDIDESKEKPFEMAIRQLLRQYSKGMNDQLLEPWDHGKEGYTLSWEIDYPETDIEVLKTKKNREI